MLVTFSTHDAAQADALLGVETIHVDGTVSSAAVPEFVSTTNALAHQSATSVTLDLGTLKIGGTADDFNVGIFNGGLTGSDSLAGTLMLISHGVTSSLGSFSGVSGGVTHSLGTLAVTPTSLGVITETIVLDPVDSRTGALPDETLTIEATVTSTPTLAVPANLTLSPGATHRHRRRHAPPRRAISAARRSRSSWATAPVCSTARVPVYPAPARKISPSVAAWHR